MAFNEIGNSIPAPGYSKGGTFVHAELLYSTVKFTQKGVTLKPGQGVLLLGTLITQDPDTKKYVKTTDVTKALGFLRQTTDTGATEDAAGWMGNIVHSGILNLAHLKAANPTVTDFTAVFNGRVNAVEGFYSF
jgi:hypothetical protein